MPLTTNQVTTLVNMVATSEPDVLDCDGCYEHMAEFAEAELANREVPDALKAVEAHLRQCNCCKDEFNALIEGLRELEHSR